MSLSAARSVRPWVLVTFCHRRIGLTPVLAAGTSDVEAASLAECRPLRVAGAGGGCGWRVRVAGTLSPCWI